MNGFTTRKWLQLCSALCLFQYIYCYCYLPDLEFQNGNVRKPPLDEDENGTFADELSVIQFICSEGYMRIGVEYIQCIFEKWTDNVPFCAGLRCSVPPEVENASYVTRSLTHDLKVGSHVDYKCNEGYQLENEEASSLQCFLKNDSDTAVWRGELPHCVAKTSCPDPGEPKHGGRMLKNGGPCCTSGDVLKFYCKSPNYELVGEEEIRCLLSGKWSSNRPLCKPLEGFCELPLAKTNGVITGDKIGDYFVQGEMARLVCDPGYKISGFPDTKCLGGSWETELGTCEEIFCKAPEPIEHGTISELKESNDTIFKFNFEINYVCDKGYRITSKHSRRVCGRRGWSGLKPRCAVVKCPDPGNPENGMKHGFNVSVGAEIRFSCSEGFELLGSIVRHCLPNGQWDGELTRCNIESNYCPDPGTPIRGSKNMTEYDKGDRVGFRCAPGNIMLGSEVRECLPDRTWSGTETKCLSKYDYDDDKVVSYILKSVVAEKATFQKEELEKYNEAVNATNDNMTIPMGMILDLNQNGRIILYFAFDVSGSIGERNFKKSIEFAKAIVRKVGISENGARAGALTFSSKAEILFWPMTFTRTEQVLDALDRVNYTGGGTSATSALKAIRIRHLPQVNENINGELKHVLFILTDGKANMGGDPSLEANLLKAEGVEIFCIGITGDENQKQLFAIASSSKYGKDDQERPNVFILKNYDTLAWLVHEITNGTVDYSECGLGLDTVGVQRYKILGGEDSAKPWPWMAALVMKTGNEPRKTPKFKCGGSIIHPRYILTAAHCMFHSEEERKPDQITVKLGLTDLRNKSFLQEFEVRRIIYHKHFHATPYDNDIALLELSRPIEFNAHIRPICLPPKEKGELYKPQSMVWAIGWGDQKRRAKNERTGNPVMSQTLKEIVIPIQTREVCNSSLADETPPLHKLFTPRMFCAGDGRGTKDICSGDSGGPLMQSAVNKDGHPIWIQVGIISWGLGCGLVDEYGFYSHVHELMHWIEDKIKSP